MLLIFRPFYLVNMYPKCALSIRIIDLIKVVDSYLIKEIKVYQLIKRLNHFCLSKKNKYYAILADCIYAQYTITSAQRSDKYCLIPEYHAFKMQTKFVNVDKFEYSEYIN